MEETSKKSSDTSKETPAHIRALNERFDPNSKGPFNAYGYFASMLQPSQDTGQPKVKVVSMSLEEFMKPPSES